LCQVVSVGAMSDEQELVDPKETLEEKCREDHHCAKYREEFEQCEQRVSGKAKTSETCLQELMDFVHCVDHCVSKSLFHHLK